MRLAMFGKMLLANAGVMQAGLPQQQPLVVTAPWQLQKQQLQLPRHLLQWLPQQRQLLLPQRLLHLQQPLLLLKSLTQLMRFLTSTSLF
ncbi:MAG: hypothetical protein RL682_1477 [Pseudomonadota bacterium]